jgi:hypothetical protein
LKKKKKKSSGTPKKAARRAATSDAKKIKKAPASKPKKKKPSTAKKASKAPSNAARAVAAKKGKRTADCTSVAICVDNFSTANLGQVCFTGIPAGGCTISQISGTTYPFTPVTGTANGLKYTDLTQTNNQVTVTVPAINSTYPYNVSCCTGPLDPGHSVTVNS